MSREPWLVKGKTRQPPATGRPVLMERREKIDGSLGERLGILRLLESLRQENITIDEMEEIGVQLQKSGRRALLLLLRKLWREESGDVISRYAYLLDFFDEEFWIGELIRITLKRRELDKEGKAALLAALKGYGVDLSTPPFARLLAEAGGLLELSLPRLLEMGEEGVVLFMDDFVYCSQEARLAVIRQMAKVSDPRVLSLLEILLWFDDADIVRETVIMLGKIRTREAADLLHTFRPHAGEDAREAVERSLRRLSFLGVTGGKPRPAAPLRSLHAAYASPIDGEGTRGLWLSRRLDSGELSTLYLQLHETTGIRTAWGCSALTDEEHEARLAEIRGEAGLVEVAPDYALLLVRDSLFRNRQHFSPLPPEFYVRRGIFRSEDLTPALYRPEFRGYDLPGLAASAPHVAESATLFDDEYFAGWFMASGRVYDFAEEWSELEKTGRKARPAQGVESVLERFCRELIVPDMEQIRQRLLLTADLMRQTGRERGVVERTLAVAESLGSLPLPCHLHPFLRRFALESMDMAREALAEGYDLREHSLDEADEDWE